MGITRTGRSISVATVPNEIDVSVVLVGRPMTLEVVEEERPVKWQPVPLKIWQRKREPVVDTDESRRSHGESRDQPLSNATARPVLARA